MNNNLLKRNKKSGFTLIEIMVSVAIFAIIMTTGIGALVSLTNAYQESQKNKKVNDALNYALETMTREIRLGSNYTTVADIDDSVAMVPNDGEDDGVGFLATDSRGYIVFGQENGVLYRIVHNPNNGAVISRDSLTNPDAVEIVDTNFTIIGTAPLTGSPNNFQQPLVWMQIRAKAPGAEDDTASSIQTLVSQRLLDA